MYGQKQIFSCLMFIILMTFLNYYKSVMKRDKEIRNHRNAEQMKHKAEEQLIHAEQIAYEAKLLQQQLHNRISGKNQYVINGMLEYDNICLALHSIVFRPNYDKIIYEYNNNNDTSSTITTTTSTSNCNDVREQKINYSKTSSSSSSVNDKCRRQCKCKKNCDKTDSSIFDTHPTGGGDDNNRNAVGGKTMDKSINNAGTVNGHNVNNNNGESSSLIYVFVLILLASLIKAAFDISKQIKERSKSDNQSDSLRRCSLHEYSLMKHKRKSFNKALEPFLKKTMITTQRSLDSGQQIVTAQQYELNRRMSANPQDYSNGSGVLTEPGTPAKPGKLLAGRPPPLLRRSSVPVFANQSINNVANVGRARRPSMDSFSEDDSSPDIKRRVRMIHRH